MRTHTRTGGKLDALVRSVSGPLLTVLEKFFLRDGGWVAACGWRRLCQRSGCWRGVAGGEETAAVSTLRDKEKKKGVGPG